MPPSGFGVGSPNVVSVWVWVPMDLAKTGLPFLGNFAINRPKDAILICQMSLLPEMDNFRAVLCMFLISGLRL